METSKCYLECKPTVTVVIPAYNVERYIRKCVESVLEQTYACMEIIIVDDGSTDSTASLIDELALDNKIIRVIHKKNAGVSEARNDGIELAKGEYIVFIDGDDWLAPDFIQYMISLVKESDADFGLSINCFTRQKEQQAKQQFTKMISPIQCTALLLSPTVIVGCWNKIYKREMLLNQNIRFSSQLFYGEGLNFIITVAQGAGKIAVGNRKVYYYRRNNASSATTQFNVESIFNGEKALDIIERNLAFEDNYVKDMMLLHRCMYNVGAVVKIVNNGKKKEYGKDYVRWTCFNRKNIAKIIKSKYVPIYRKLLLTAGCISPEILAKFDIVRRKRIYRNSIGD